VAAAPLTEAHRLTQNRLGAQTVAQLLAVWNLVDIEDLDASTGVWLQAAVPIVRAQHRQSAQLAAGYLRTFRATQLGTLAGPIPSIAEFDPRRVATSLTVTGPVALKSAMARGLPLIQADDIARARMAAAGLRQALDGGRETVAATVAADPQAVGYARVTSGKACQFCSMLADRGAVYSDDSVHFEAHDGCSCSAEPVYR
jgi:hypothetical protein